MTPEEKAQYYQEKLQGFFEAVTLVFQDIARNGDVDAFNHALVGIYQIGQHARLEMEGRNKRLDN